MRNIGIILCVLVILLTGACKKKIMKVDRNFGGDWEHSDAITDHEMYISPSGYITYFGYDGNKEENHMGEGKINKRKDELSTKDRTWKINSYPHEETDAQLGVVWRMTLDGIVYTRY